MGMGQVTLGLRSLVIKLTVFFVLAALLAWALGGTLWPRAETADMNPVPFDGRSVFWRLSVGGEQPGDGIARWSLMARQGDSVAAVDARQWIETARLVVTGETLVQAGLIDAPGGPAWLVIERRRDGAIVEHPVPDRLAVEQQLQRIAAELPVQDAATIAAQRAAVLDPGRTSAAPGPGR
jgi:hypothetical protein